MSIGESSESHEDQPLGIRIQSSETMRSMARDYMSWRIDDGREVVGCIELFSLMVDCKLKWRDRFSKRMR